MNELDWKQPALVGGVTAGLLSVIPLVNLVNCCFCAWLLVGGAVAAKMLIDRTPRPLRSGEGAQVGAIAGLIASGIYSLISLALVVLGVGQNVQQQQEALDRVAERTNDPNIREAIQRIGEMLVNQSPAGRILLTLAGMAVVTVIYVGFSTLGGLLGVAMFEKRRNQPPPPQYPPQYPPPYPPNYPQQSTPGADYPPQNPPQSGGSGGDQGGWPQG
ncbi:MAG TPA: hypothetical protein VIC84_17635 [Blastocatellia bacterium]|jgi:hypothetical protein